jgi:hypothetical protein
MTDKTTAFFLFLALIFAVTANYWRLKLAQDFINNLNTIHLALEQLPQ